MLRRLLCFCVLAEFNREEAIDILIEKSVITEENSKTMDFFTRGDMAKIIYEARKLIIFIKSKLFMNIINFLLTNSFLFENYVI